MPQQTITGLHMAGANGIAAIAAALLPVFTSTPGLPAWAVAVALGVNAALHYYTEPPKAQG